MTGFRTSASAIAGDICGAGLASSAGAFSAQIGCSVGSGVGRREAGGVGGRLVLGASKHWGGGRACRDVSGQDFEAWYGRQHGRMLAAVSLWCGDADVAREAVDEAFSRALARWGRVSSMEEPTGWTYRVAVNQVRRLARRRRRERLLAQQGVVGPVAPVDGAVLWDAVARLPPRQRDVFVQRYVLDLPEAEIAATLGISRGAVSATTAKARAALAAALGDHDEERVL